MDALAQEIGYAVIGLGFLMAILWLVSRSPLLAWLLKVGLLVLWGIATLGAVLYVVFGIYLPEGRYGVALLSVAVGAVGYVPWFAFGVPELKNSFKKQNRSHATWE